LRSVGAKSYSTIVDRFTKKKMKEIFELRCMNFGKRNDRHRSQFGKN
jgi:hypothetical protein